MSAPQDPFADPGQQGAQPPGASPQPPRTDDPAYGGGAYGSAPAYGGGAYGGGGYGGGGYGQQTGPRNGFGLTALITGILGLLFGVVPFTFPLGIVLGVVAVVFGLLGRRRVGRGEANNRGQALAGLICGVLGLLAGLAWLIGITVFVSNNLHHCPPGYRNSQGIRETYSTSC